MSAPGASGTGASGGGAPPRLRLAGEAWSELAGHVESAYPGEGCGVLLGRDDGGPRVAMEAVPAPNQWGERDDRYAVDPDLLRELMEREEAGGPAVIGFYHSHPDAEPVPSDTDRERSWPWYHYLIVPVTGGEAGRPRVWQFDGRRDPPREGRVQRAESMDRREPEEDGGEP